MQFYLSEGNKIPIYGFEMQNVFVCSKVLKNLSSSSTVK